MPSIRTDRTRLGLLLACGLLLGLGLPAVPAPGAAQTTSVCGAAFAVDVTLPNGANWALCWEERAAEGIRLWQIRFTPPGGPQRLLIYQADLAQIHVPYDNNAARFHDLTDYGLGGSNLDNLTQAECPGGTLLVSNGRNVLCQIVGPAGYGFKSYGVHKQATALTLFSVSHPGAYNYIVRWTFLDNGAIEPAIGASGQLVLCTTDPAYGWLVNGTPCPRGASHTHNYYWRLDFDLAGSANDRLQEFEFSGGGTELRPIVSTDFTAEAARRVAPTEFRLWRLWDGAVTNADGHAISYELQPTANQIFRGPGYEPWTANDLYFTRYRPCEKWASHNPTNGGACGGDVSAFVNGEEIHDAVIWYGVTFHHLARDEDEPHMSAHWSGFRLTPRDMTATNPQ